MSVFISYSRRNTDFVRRLHEGMVAHGRETWVDWEGIPPTADWMNEIHAAIDAAEAVAFVLSPDSIKSAVCLQELEHALAQNKRLIPLVCQEVNPGETPPALARLNWVFFTGDDFDKALQTLLSAVDTDLDWVKAHTRLLVRAAEWDRKAREPSLALRGADLKAAEQWLTEGPTKSPPPTELQTRYVIESRRLAVRRRTFLLSGVGVALIVSAVLGTLFLLQRKESGRQEAVAVSRRLAAVAERVQDAPLEYSDDASRLHLGVQLAAEALRRVDAVGERSVEADRVLRAAVARLPQRIAQLGGDDALRIDALAFLGGAELVAASKAMSASVIWRLDDSKPVGGGKDTGKANANAVVLSPDGGTLATIEPKHPEGPVAVREARSHALKVRIRESTDAVDVALAPGATYALVTQVKWLPDKNSYEPPVSTLWQLPPDGHDAREIVKLPPIFGPVFSPDGAYLAALGKDYEPLIWSVERLSKGDPLPLRSLAADAPLAGRSFFSPDGRYLAISYGENPNRIGVWAVSDWSRVYDLPAPEASHLIAVAPGGRYVALAAEHGSASLVRVFDSEHQCEVTQALAGTTAPVVAFAAAGRRMALGAANRIDILEFPSGCGDERQFDSLTGAVEVAFSADERQLHVVARSGEGLALQRVEVSGARVLSTTPLGSAVVLQFSGDGSALALASDNRVRLVDVATGRERASVTSTDVVAALALSADAGYLAAATRGKVLQVWSGASLHELPSAPLPEPLDASAGSLAIDPRRVVAITRSEARRIGEPLNLESWTLPAMAHAATPVGQDRGGFAANVCGLSKGGGRVAINAGVSGIRVRETASGQDIVILDDPGKNRRCAFSADERYLAVETEGFIRIWDVGGQIEVAQLRASAGVRSFAFSPGGRYLVAVLENGNLGRWLLRPRDLIEDACARLPEKMSQDNWERYVGSTPYIELCPGLAK
ncbi:WD40 repeat [Cupriavidus sp. YR651]|uniref:toll/interleukin-1 receptor domain-containing protein n=1 Tax=Cupriavidus sp. YR651 TaxID=1855315 RepID=UPI000883582A|nr:toll/interleukin-1 receptor domain-containing protein [Cupriavidus sp. YR651]SDC67039.1 WD40 repeat [Cupriavidus sp. YR651]